MYIGSKLVPHFDTYSNWREVRIVSRSDGSTSSTSTSHSHVTQGAPRSHPWDPSVMLRSAVDASAATSKHGSDSKLLTRNIAILFNCYILIFR